MAAPAEPARRTEEIEAFSNLYLIHPIAARLVPVFARLGITPNAVSLTGMGCGILAGLAYTRYAHWRFCVAGFALMLAWHVMDGADGQLARLTRTQSELGKILDGICDYVTFIAVYTGLGVVLAERHGAWVVALVAAAGACHAVQSAAYETQRQAYDFYGNGKASAALPDPGTVANPLYRAYAAAQRIFAPAAAPQDPAAGRARYRAAFAPAIRRWSILGANTRTLGIFLCAIAGHPLAYFWFELFGFSAILAVLLVGQRRRLRRFMEEEAAF